MSGVFALVLFALGFLVGYFLKFGLSWASEIPTPKDSGGREAANTSTTWTREVTTYEIHGASSCPVENCRIRTPHSHTEALIRRINENR